MLPNYFDYIFVHLRQKSTSQAQIKPEIFVNFRPEPGPNPNRTQKARPDLQLCTMQKILHPFIEPLHTTPYLNKMVNYITFETNAIFVMQPVMPARAV